MWQVYGWHYMFAFLSEIFALFHCVPSTLGTFPSVLSLGSVTYLSGYNSISHSSPIFEI